jgi:hypothetical protein
MEEKGCRLAYSWGDATLSLHFVVVLHQITTYHGLFLVHMSNGSRHPAS